MHKARLLSGLKSLLRSEILFIAGYTVGVTAGGIFAAMALLPYLVRGS